MEIFWIYKHRLIIKNKHFIQFEDELQNHYLIPFSGWIPPIYAGSIAPSPPLCTPLLKVTICTVPGVMFTQVSPLQWHVFPHTAARVLGLIVLPIAVYLSTFVIHFWVLTNWYVMTALFIQIFFVGKRYILMIWSAFTVYRFFPVFYRSVNGGGFYPTKFFAAFSNTEYDNATFPERKWRL